jgi:hypothetical protein
MVWENLTLGIPVANLNGRCPGAKLELVGNVGG